MPGDTCRITLSPGALTFRAESQVTLLDCAISAGIAVPAACRNGVCELCEARLMSGQAVNTRNQQIISVPGRLMMCRSIALSDLELETEAVMAAGNIPPRKFQAKVVEVGSINHDVYRVKLQIARRRELSFHAGQYLSVNLPGEDPCYFSIASSPTAEQIELHIQATPEWVSAQKVIDALTSGSDVTLEMPHGRACLASAPEKPLLMVAAGTGFAQMKSLVDYLRETGFNQPARLYWGVRRRKDLYLGSLAREWEQQWPIFTYRPVVGDNEDNEWAGHHEQLVSAVLASGVDWKDVEVHASGSPTMVYALLDALLDAGLPEQAFFSDVLEYAPRN